MTIHGTRPILVVGRSGQLARSLADIAASRELPLIALGRPEFDLEQPDMIDRIVSAIRPSVIVNAGAYTAVDKAEFEPERALAINRDGAGHLASIASRCTTPFIHVSTDYVFDGKKPTPYQEGDRPLPLGVYGRSKLEGEQAVLNACPTAIVLRTSWCFSEHGSNFVKTMLRLAETQKVIRVVGDQRGAPTSTRDLATAIFNLIPHIHGRSGAGVYHLTAAGETSWHGFAAAIFAGWARRGERVPALERIQSAEYPTPARRPANCRLDCAKIEAEFGIRLPVWTDSLETCLDSLQMEQTRGRLAEHHRKEPLLVQAPAL